MDAELFLEHLSREFLGWLATLAVHSVVLCAIAWLLDAALPRLLRDRAALAAIRERAWKVAVFGPFLTATLSVSGALTPPVALTAAASSPSPSATYAEPAFTPSEPSPPPTALADPFPWLGIATALWVVGASAGALAWLRDRRRLRRRLRGRAPLASGPARELLDDLRRRSGAHVDPGLWCAADLASPITVGVLRPAIVLPPRAEPGLLRDELRAMLAHELAHADRRDPLLRALTRAVGVLLFFQPLLRITRARLHEQAEILCDERAARWTGDPASLASCLAEVATWVVGAREDPAPAMAARGSRLAERVRGLLDRTRDEASALRRRFLGSAVLAFAVAPLAIPGLSLGNRALADSFGSPAATERAPAPIAASEPDADLARGVAELRALLLQLETDHAAMAADPRTRAAGEEVRERVAAIGRRLRELRAMDARLEQLLQEASLPERQVRR